jgi:hypothetical protein
MKKTILLPSFFFFAVMAFSQPISLDVAKYPFIQAEKNVL